MSVVYDARSGNPPKSRPALLPLLVVLFVASYTILTMLVVEQGRTIDAQRGLLRDMLRDSTQLADLRGKLARESQQQAAPKAARQPMNNQKEQATRPVPAPPKARANNQGRQREKAPHTMKEVPPRPAEDLQDARRSTSVT